MDNFLCHLAFFVGASRVALVVKNLTVNGGDIRDQASILGWEDPLEEEMATHSSILACRIMRVEEHVLRITESRTHLKRLNMHTWLSL